MDNISQIISRSIGGYSIGSILSALLTFLICLIVVRLVLKLCSRLLSRANRLNERLQKVILTSLKTLLYLLTFSHPFSLGDEIEVGGTTGTVREISLTHTKIETPDGQIVLQPNREMSSSKIINFTVLGRRRIVYKVTASYDAPTDEVKQACMDAVLAFPAVLKEPTPTVYLSNYGASSIEYTIRCWTAADAYWDTYFKMYERLRNTFAKHNVEMSYDHLNIHVVPEKQNEN